MTAFLDAITTGIWVMPFWLGLYAAGVAIGGWLILRTK